MANCELSDILVTADGTGRNEDLLEPTLRMKMAVGEVDSISGSSSSNSALSPGPKTKVEKKKKKTKNEKRKTRITKR